MLKRSRKPILAIAGDAALPASHAMTTSIKYVEETPRSIRRFELATVRQEELELTAADVEHVAEIFNTPLTGELLSNLVYGKLIRRPPCVDRLPSFVRFHRRTERLQSLWRPA